MNLCIVQMVTENPSLKYVKHVECNSWYFCIKRFDLKWRRVCSKLWDSPRPTTSNMMEKIEEILRISSSRQIKNNFIYSARNVSIGHIHIGKPSLLVLTKAQLGFSMPLFLPSCCFWSALV